VEKTRTGNHAVFESGHTLIIGWNKNIFHLLRQVGRRGGGSNNNARGWRRCRGAKAPGPPLHRPPQIILARQERGDGSFPGPLVLMANLTKAEMDKRIQAELGRSGLQVGHDCISAACRTAAELRCMPVA
jgi:hypothetical protein